MLFCDSLSERVYVFFVIQSASRGFPDAQYNLGAMYLSGVGVPQSFSKGFTWLTRALEQGHSGATYMMGVIHLNGIGTLRDCRLAAALFKRVASKHSWVAERLQKVTKSVSSRLLCYGTT